MVRVYSSQPQRATVVGFDAGDDACLGFWKTAWEGGHVPLPQGARVLEVGCAEADWLTPMKAERPDLHLTGLDWRTCERPGADELVQGDVLSVDLPFSSFDAVVSVSAMEHIGLGYYSNDPKAEDGDTLAAENIWRWLKPGGLFYFDVPYRPNGPYQVHGSFRAYDRNALYSRLLFGFKVLWMHIIDNGHPDGPYIAVVAQK